VRKCFAVVNLPPPPKAMGYDTFYSFYMTAYKEGNWLTADRKKMHSQREGKDWIFKAKGMRNMCCVIAIIKINE
jgi:hypothetical protein